MLELEFELMMMENIAMESHVSARLTRNEWWALGASLRNTGEYKLNRLADEGSGAKLNIRSKM